MAAMQSKRRIWVIVVAVMAALALVATDMMTTFAAAEDYPVTAVPAQVLVERAEPAEPILVAQRRRTLMDLLFGEEPQQQEQPVVERPVKRKPAPQAALPPAKPAIEKAPGATRLAVFGDSMAVDLSKALERLYAEDPNIVIVGQGVGSSGFVRTDFFDWNKTIGEQIAANSFDIAVVTIGINDRQKLRLGGTSYGSLSPEWTVEYTARVANFVTQLRNANKPTIWVGLPPMQAPNFAKTMAGINEIQKLSVFSAGAEFLDIYERFLSAEGAYTSFGPDLSGNRVRMRKDDGIHLSAAGADKVAFFLSQTLRLYYRGGGGFGFEVADPLLGTDAQLMVRPPYQGLGQMTLLEVAGAVISLTHAQRRAMDLVTAETAQISPAGFDMSMLIDAPVGRVDAFGVGKRPAAESANPGGR